MNRNPVLLVHGIFRKKGVFKKMSAYLSSLLCCKLDKELAERYL
jgi:hypothetical protein